MFLTRICYVLALIVTCYYGRAEQSQIIPKELRGRVVNENNEPVQASVRVKGSDIFTATNDKGVFLLTDVPDSAVIVISGVGIQTMELSVRGREDLGVIVLKSDIKEEDEVLIYTGYETKRPNELNGAVSIVDKKMLNQQVGTNILNRLDGATTGLLFNVGKSNNNPQNTTNISIRGLSTINGPLDPLIVLDGFIYEGDIKNINPNTIESITVLKDAVAVSIWGARAGNGVIVIQTEKGQFNKKLNIQVNSSVLTAEEPNLFDLPLMNSSDYIDVEEFLFNVGYFNSRINNGYQALTPAIDVFNRRRLGLISAADSAQIIDRYKSTDTRAEYQKYVYRSSITQQNSLSLNGGSANHSYNFAATYDYNLGFLHDIYQKTNLNVTNSFRFSPALQLDITCYYTNSRARGGKTPFGTLRPAERSVNYFPLVDENGQPASLATSYRDSYTDTAGGGKLLDWKYYPLREPDLGKSYTKTNELYATVGLRYKLFKGLTLDFKYQLQHQSIDKETISFEESYAARNLVNLFTQLNRNTGAVTYVVPPGDIRTRSISVISSNTLRGQLNYLRKWRQHEVSALLGSEVRQRKENSESNTFYGFDEDPLSYQLVDQVNPYRTFVTGAFQTVGGPSGFSNKVHRFASFYSNFSYSYLRRYSIYASARKEGSNIFGLNTNDKWKPLWSVGAGWRLTDEKFFKSNFIHVLKLRLSFGYSGNVDMSKTALPIARYFSGSSPTFFPFGRIMTLNNPSLKWEESKQKNIGIDFVLKNGILSGSIDYYLKEGSDLYGEAPYDYTGWGASSTITRNVASMKGDGIEVNLNAKLLKRNLRWNTTLLFTYSQSKTTKYYSSSPQSITRFLGGGHTIVPVVGQPMYGIAAYRWGGLDGQGNPQGYLNGELSTDYSAIASAASRENGGSSVKFMGSGSPLIFGSWINQVSMNGISVTVNFSYRLKYYSRKSGINYDALVFSGIGHREFSRRWQKPGDEVKTNVPSFSYPIPSSRDLFYNASEVHVFKGDHVRIQYINLAYSLPAKVERWLGSGEIYINISNLGIIWRANKDGLDPDYPESIRPSRTMAIGWRIKF